MIIGQSLIGFIKSNNTQTLEIVSKIAKPAMTTDLAEGIILIVWGSSVVDKVNHVVF